LSTKKYMRIKTVGIGALLLSVSLVFLSSCELTKPVKTGDMAYEFKQYGRAVELLEEEYKGERDDRIKARKARYLGKSLDMLEEYGKALKWYDIADQLYQSENSALELAQSLKRNERYTDAAELYGDMFRKYGNQTYRSESAMSQQAARELSSRDDYKVETMAFNTEYAEYSPIYFEDAFIIFSSDRGSGTGNAVYKWNDRYFADLFVADNSGRQVYNFDALINTDNNEGVACFTRDFNEIFFTRCVSTDSRDQYCKLYYSQRPNGFWLEPEPLMFYGDQTNFAHPCLLEQDSVLVFTAKPEGSSNYDLYYSVRLGNGWSEAEIMHSSINTEGDEMFPTSYGDTLFFASDGHIGFGGLDIFKTVLQPDGQWTRPENLGWPVNSGADDFGLAIKPGSEDNEMTVLEGLFSSSRNTNSSTDIFSIVRYRTEEPSEEEEIAEQEETEREEDYLVYLSGRIVENLRKDDDPNAEVIDTRPVERAMVTISYGKDTSRLEVRAGDEGRFLLSIDSEEAHHVLVQAKEYLSKEKQVNIPEFESLESDTTINLTFALDKIVYDQEIIISDIYYDFDSAAIRADAEPALDSLASMLELNKQLDIELGSHTDCRGGEDYNLDLSQRRAESVVTYLGTAGIDSTRMRAIGYGESRMAVECECNSCTEEEHQANRRTTFKILKPE